jgi:hypothetical protein
MASVTYSLILPDVGTVLPDRDDQIFFNLSSPAKSCPLLHQDLEPG